MKNMKLKIKKLLWMPMIITPAFVLIGCKVEQSTNQENNNSETDQIKTPEISTNEKSNNNSENNSTTPSTPDSKTEIKEDKQEDKGIRYVAFGDSIAAGFNPDLGGFSAPGKLEENKSITGLSYPAFIAQYIQKIHPEKLSAFENFGLLGTNTTDWLYLLGENEESKNSQRTFELLKTIDALKQNPFQNHIKKQFNNFSKTDLTYFHNKLKEANLITVSLGANDIPSFNSIVELIFFFLTADKPTSESDIQNFEGYWNDQIQNAQRNVNTITVQLKSNLKKIVKRIKSLNSKANINLIGYPMPFARLAKYLNTFIQNKNINDWLSQALASLNNIIKEVAKEEKVNFIDAYDQTNWNKNPEKYAKYFYDLHPTTKGYKKMAQDILLKMISKEKLNPQWDNAFVNSDKDTKNPSIKFDNVEIPTITNKILGNNNSDLDQKSTLETNTQLNKILKDNENKGAISNIIRLYLSSSPNDITASPFYSILTNIFNAPRQLISFFTNPSNINLALEIFNTFVNSNYIDTVFTQIEKELDSKDLDQDNVAGTQNITWDIIRNVFKEKAFNINNMFLFIKALLSSNFTKQNAEKAKELYPWFISVMLFNKDVQKDRTTLNVSSEEYNHFTSNVSFNQKFTALAQNIVSQASTYAQQTNFVTFFKLFVTNNSETLKTLFDEIIKDFISKPNIIMPSLKEFTKGLNITITDESRVNLDALVKDTSVYPKIQNAILEGLKAVADDFNGTFDDFYKEITKQIITKLSSSLTQEEKTKVQTLLNSSSQASQS